MSSSPAVADATTAYTRSEVRVTYSTVRWLRNRRELAGFVIDILCYLISEGATGRLSINLTQGCAASAEFERREPMDDVS